MKRLAILASAALVASLTLAAKPLPTAPTTYAYSYVAYDLDGDKKASIGDEVRWFVASDTDVVVTLTCWTDATKATVVQTFTSPTFTVPLTGYGTPSGVTLTASGYCESRATSGTKVVGSHWFIAVP